MELCSPLFFYRPPAKEEITSPVLYQQETEAWTHKSSSLPFPVNKIPFVHAACLLPWVGVGILALPLKGYCQFIKGLFILWGSAGREVQVTRRKGGSVPCVPHKSAKDFSLFTGYLASVRFGEVARAPQCPLAAHSDLKRKASRGGGEGVREHEGQRPLSDRLINRAPG